MTYDEAVKEAEAKIAAKEVRIKFLQEIIANRWKSLEAVAKEVKG